MKTQLALNSAWQSLNYYFFLLAALILIIFVAHNSFAQSDPANQSGNLVCDLSGLMPLSGDETIASGQKLVTRGMASCHTDQGFTSDVPVKIEITASLKDFKSKKVNIKAVAQPFAVPREQSQIFDNYTMLTSGPRSTPPDEGDATTLALASAPTRSFVMKGSRNSLLIELNLTGQDGDLQDLSIKDMRLSYDDKAPSLKTR